MMPAMQRPSIEPATARHRRRWANSKALRDQVRAQLTEWAAANAGGMPDLGYYHEQHFHRSPEPGGRTWNPDRVDALTDSITLWRLIAQGSGGHALRACKRLQRVLALHFLGGDTAARNAKRMGVSRQHYYRLLDDAMFTVWVVHDLCAQRLDSGM